MSPTFNFSTGNINNLVAGGTASMTDIQGPFVDLRDFINGQLGDSNLSASAAITETKLANGSTGLAKGAFSAYRNAAQTVATAGLVGFDTDSGTGFDVSGWYDTSTGLYTPQRAGYYRLSTSVASSAAQAADVFWQVSLRKNGVELQRGPIAYQRGTQPVQAGGTWIVQANGSTDAFSIILLHNNGGTPNIGTGLLVTYFQGEFVGGS